MKKWPTGPVTGGWFRAGYEEAAAVHAGTISTLRGGIRRAVSVLRRVHRVEHSGHGDECHGCGSLWPCPSAVVAGHLEALLEGGA
jgi:hypothetical protein